MSQLPTVDLIKLNNANFLKNKLEIKASPIIKVGDFEGISISSYKNLLKAILDGTTEYISSRPTNSTKMADRRAGIVKYYVEKINAGERFVILALLCSIFRPYAWSYFSYGRSQGLAWSIAHKIIQGNKYRSGNSDLTETYNVDTLSSNCIETGYLKWLSNRFDNVDIIRYKPMILVDKRKTVCSLLQIELSLLKQYEKESILAITNKLESYYASSIPTNKLNFSDFPPQEMQEKEHKNEGVISIAKSKKDWKVFEWEDYNHLFERFSGYDTYS